MKLIRLSCKQAHQLVSEGLDRDLGVVERLRLRLHLGMCDACTNFNGQMNFLRSAMRQYPMRDIERDTESKNDNDNK
jgi:predicted anti-sigma-YlaC factor YlaD